MPQDKHSITFGQKLEILEFIEEYVAFGRTSFLHGLKRLREHGVNAEMDQFGFPQFSRYYSGPIEPGMRFRCIATDVCVPGSADSVFQVASCSDGRVSASCPDGRGSKSFSCDEEWFRECYAVEETDAG